MAPEESLLQQVCFICQRDIDINSLTRCKRTSCCGVFIHKICHGQMVSMLPTCGNCRHRNDEFQREVVLEADEEMESDEDDPFAMSEGTFPSSVHVMLELIEYRRDRRYLNTHYQGSLFWREVPYEADPGIWLNYYYQMEMFIRLLPGQPLYVHGRVVMPCEPTEWRRRAVYRISMYNTPFSLFDTTNSSDLGSCLFKTVILGIFRSIMFV